MKLEILLEANKTDTITVDVPLFIRLLEFSREDAKTDIDLHDVAERAIKLSLDGRVLTMRDYKKLLPPMGKKKD